MDKESLASNRLCEMLASVTYDKIRTGKWWHEMHEVAMECNALVVFPFSDDLLYTAWYEHNYFAAWEGGTIHVASKGVVSVPEHMAGKWLFSVTSIWVDRNGRAWDVITSARHYSTFDIYNEGELWGNGIVIDMDAELKEKCQENSQ